MKKTPLIEIVRAAAARFDQLPAYRASLEARAEIQAYRAAPQEHQTTNAMSETTMRAFHGDPALKAKYLQRVQEHQRADAVTQGVGWSRGRGCAVGCTLEFYDHGRYPSALGIPLQLAHLEDALFEIMPVDSARRWPEQFLEAIRPGADLSGVWGYWAFWMLLDPEHGVLQHARGQSAIETLILQVATLYAPSRRGLAAERDFAPIAERAETLVGQTTTGACREAAAAAAAAARASWSASAAARTTWAAAGAAGSSAHWETEASRRTHVWTAAAAHKLLGLLGAA